MKEKDVNLKDDIYILGIESSCDETSAAIVKNGRKVLSNVINSQIDEHEKYGGVVPEIASRMHAEAISDIVDRAIKEANITVDDISAVAVTRGPGLIGALFVGVAYAKAFALRNKKKLIGVNHLEGHVAANYITHPELKPPFMGLVISGGHTHLVHVKDYNDYEIVGKTRDDAIGEAFDKVARVIGLGYPGGPKIDKIAKEGKPKYYSDIPKPKVDGYDFSFSGVKTSIINMNHNSKEELNKADLANSLEKVLSEIIIDKSVKAMKEYNLKDIVVCGGVSANSYIRERFKEINDQGFNVYFPELSLSTDNGAMIAASGYYYYLAGKFSGMELDAKPNLRFGEGW